MYQTQSAMMYRFICWGFKWKKLRFQTR